MATITGIDSRSRPSHAGCVALTLLMTLQVGCNGTADESHRQDAESDTAQAAAARETDHPGRRLVEIHCVRCHLAAEPGDLPREVWSVAVSWMSLYLGFDGGELPGIDATALPERARTDYETWVQFTTDDGFQHTSRQFTEFDLPGPIITPDELGRIRDYLVSGAQPEADMRLRRPQQPATALFNPKGLELDGLGPAGIVFRALVDSANDVIYVASGQLGIASGPAEQGGRKRGEGVVAAFDIESGRLLGRSETETKPMNLELVGGQLRVASHGVDPGSRQDGRGRIVDVEGLDSGELRQRMLMNGYDRLVQSHTRDLDNDGRDDLVVNGFGDGILHLGAGRLTVYWKSANYDKAWQDAPAEIDDGPLPGAFEEQVLMERAGLISTAVDDLNDDGLPDIVLLTAQGRQEMIVFENLGDRQFSKHLIEEWRPSQGNVRVNTGDFDGDGKTDLVVLNGNNVELVTTRPQHGIRLFRNDGQMTFSEHYSYALPGTINSVADDFDQDGDVDIAAIALWPDWQRDEPETFVYLENLGGWNFKPWSLPRDGWSVWLSIDKHDIDADGDMDIVLGSGFVPRFFPEQVNEKPIIAERNGAFPSVQVLENRLIAR